MDFEPIEYVPQTKGKHAEDVRKTLDEVEKMQGKIMKVTRDGETVKEVTGFVTALKGSIKRLNLPWTVMQRGLYVYVEKA